MSTQKKSYVVIDTCIVQHWANTELAKGILLGLQEAISVGYGLAISEYTLFEALDGANPEKENLRLGVMHGLKNFYVRKKVLRVASRLGAFYQAEGAEDCANKGDRIIAATAILSPGSIIYTTNGRHFPLPFFEVLRKSPLHYSKNGRDVVIMDYFVRPDMNAINQAYQQWAKSN